MLNLLDAIITLPETAFGSGLNFLGNIIKWIVEIVPNVGLGIILFTLILKVITLPLDIYSKSSMRKNSLKMEKMRPQLEKLQKQYANDQNAYNAKMMEMYKKNGYSMLGACLPMIVTLVIFMIVLGAFSDYSAYTNVDVYRKMAAKYNGAVVAYAPDIESADAENVEYIIDKTNNSEGKFTCTRRETYEQQDKLLRVVITKTQVLDEGTNYQDESVWADVSASSVSYEVISAKVSESKDEAFLAALQQAKESEEGKDMDADSQAVLALKILGRNAAEKQYQAENSHFLWIKNIWLSDTSYTHPVQKEPGVPQETFDEITKNLAAEKSAANGYFILIVISIGSMFLSQFILMKSQKAQNELQTADGRGAKTQKIMMIVMPVMFGIFAFAYSAAFSIYMIVSSLYGIASTLIINFFIDRKFAKIEEREIQEKYNKRIPQAAKKNSDTRNGGKKQ